MKNEVVVGNEYKRQLGITKQFVTVVGINDDGTVNVVSKSGKQKFKTRIENIDKWELIKDAEGGARPAPAPRTRKAREVAVTSEGVKVGKRLNSTSFVNVLIDTLKASNVPMNARQLVDKVTADGTFKFKETAKTPWNSASSRLNSYIKTHGDESEVKMVSRGVFAKKDYVAPTTEAQSEQE